jgi:hypothetical protein
MRQIFNPNATFENVGDYAFAILESSEYGGFMVHCLKHKEDRWAIYGLNHRIFSGAEAPRHDSTIAVFPHLRIFTTSWILTNESLKAGLSWLCDDNNLRFIGIVQNNLPVDGIITDQVGIRGLTLASPYDESSISADAADSIFSDLIAADYTSETLYSGFCGYHAHHGMTFNAPKRPKSKYQFGIELEVEFHERDLRNRFTNTKSNWFYCESDGSLGSNGCEIITIPLEPKHAKSEDFWLPLIDELKNTAQSWETGRCGLHVHVSREILGRTEEQITENLGKLLYLYHHHLRDTRMNVRIFGRERGYNEHDGKTAYGDAVSIIGTKILKENTIKEELKTKMIQRTQQDRYFDINIRNSKTIEFRKGRGSINQKRIVSIIEYCELMCKYCKDTPWQQICYDDFVSYIKVCAKGDTLREYIGAA